MKNALKWLERNADIIMIAIMIITLVVAILSLLAAAVIGVTGKIEGNAEAQKETVIAEIAMPDGNVVSGNVEEYKDYGRVAWEVKINGITYITGKENVVIIKGGAGIQEE